MHVSVAEYEATPALVVDWDLALHDAEQRAADTLSHKR